MEGVKELEKSLGDIKEGIKAVVAGQGAAEAKFIDLEKTSKDMGESIKTLDGRVMAIEAYLKDRKGGLSVSLPGLEEEKKRKSFSFAKSVCGAYFQAHGQPHMWEQLKAGYEKEVLTQATQKAIDTGTAGSGGGYVIPQEYVADIIELIRAETVVIKAGATVLDGLQGSPIRIPKQTGSGTVYWIGQNADITKADATFGEIQMTPKTMAMRMQFSNLLNILANPAIEQLIRNDFALAAALELDRVSLRGSGASNQPLGLANMAGIGTYEVLAGAGGGDYTRFHALRHVGVVEDKNALRGRLGFVTNPKIRRKLMNERIAQYSGDTGGQYVILPMSAQQLQDNLGYPMLTTTQIPSNIDAGGGNVDATEVYFGNWAELMIGMWGAMEILSTNIGGNAWAQNAIEVRLVQNMDVQIRHAESFALCNDARTNNA